MANCNFIDEVIYLSCKILKVMDLTGMGVSMGDIESKYFIDENKYNCPFCKNRGVKYIITGIARFNEKRDKDLYAVFVKCSNCHNVSMHLVKKDKFVNFEANINHTYYDCDFLLLSNFCSDLVTYSDKRCTHGVCAELKNDVGILIIICSSSQIGTFFSP